MQYPGVTIDFDFSSKSSTAGEEVTKSCPSGGGTCTATCSNPGAAEDGGWTFPSSCCGPKPANKGPTCSSYNPYSVAYPTSTVDFDLSKVDHTAGEKVTQNCPNGQGTCSATCLNPGGVDGGWQMPESCCEPKPAKSGPTCTLYYSYTVSYSDTTVDFDLSKNALTAGEKVTQNCPNGQGTCSATCSKPGGVDGGWTMPPSCCAPKPVPPSGPTCAAYASFKMTYSVTTIDFDFSKGGTYGEKVTKSCPNGNAAGCTATCSNPGRHYTNPADVEKGGWTFPSLCCPSPHPNYKEEAENEKASMEDEEDGKPGAKKAAKKASKTIVATVKRAMKAANGSNASAMTEDEDEETEAAEDEENEDSDDEAE